MTMLDHATGVGGCPAYPFKRDLTKPLDPAPQVGQLRLERPITKVRLWDGKQAWLATRYDDIRALLSDKRTSAVPVGNYPMLSPGVAQVKIKDLSFLRADPPIHTARRVMWQPFFAPKNIARIKPRIAQFIEQALDNLVAAGPGADLVRHLALPVPSLTIADLLAVPNKDHDFFHRMTIQRSAIDQSPEQIVEAMAALQGFWERLVDERSVNPGDDLVSQLIVREVNSGKLTRDALVADAQLVLVAGHDSTANMIGLGTYALLERPELVRRIREDPSRTLALVEDMIRFFAIPHNGLQRLATDRIEIGGVAIEAGDGIILHIGSGNRDGSAFHCADELRTDRTANRHLSFGAASHLCIGAPLARLELQMVFDALFARLPDLRFHGRREDVPFKVENLFYGLESLPVAW